MNLRKLLPIILLLISISLSAQKKPISHSDYDGWKRLTNAQISNNGNWVNYVINPQEGDGWLYFYDVKKANLDSVSRGYGAKTSAKNDFIVFMIKPTFSETRQAKKDKKKKDDMPKNKLGINNLKTGEVKIINNVKSFKLAEENQNWLAYLKEKKIEKKAKKNDKSVNPEAEKPEAGKRPARKPKTGKAKGTELVILNPIDDAQHSFKDVIEYQVAKNGSTISFVQVTTDTNKVDAYKVKVFNTSSQTTSEIFSGEGSVKKLTLNNEGNNFAFMYSSDTSKVKVFDLYLSTGSTANNVVDTETDGMIEDWSVSENGSLSFSENGKRLFFGTALKPVEEPKDTLLADEKYSLDIWSWDDPLLQPQQKIQLKNEQRRTYQAVFHIGEAKMIQLANTEIPNIRLLQKKDGDLALGTSNLKYRKETSWDASRYSDNYLVNVNTGETNLLKEKAPSSVALSPNGKYMMFWCVKCKSWYAKPTAGGDAVNLTKSLELPFHNELHDSPSEPRPHGIAGWIEGERYVLIYDRYDIWKIDVTGVDKAVNLTNGYGRENNIRFRYISLEATSGGSGGRFGGGSRNIVEIKAKELIYLSAFNYYSKQSGVYTVKENQIKDPTKIVMDDNAYTSYKKAKDADKLIWQKGTYVQSPEIHISGMKFNNATQISITNPQQNDYNWGTVELVEWMSFDGQKLQGLMYKPENFDPNKKYPMIAYFYERSSDGLHRYIAPAPSASTINRTYAVSNEYLIFVPDIPYIIGYPGHSAYNAVVSGTYAMLNQFDYIDETRLGLDGQSWGGYQIAYLITETDLFACAFSGAPVSNMTSAYGGIRWASGMNRAFQYEQTQSRIGGTLWEKTLQYIENSPLFFVPKINTPVMIMHNDADGAVPWYQGIEFINALRRLSKPAWMVSYNKEAHNLRKRPNRKDLSVRKMQFFDHYLQGAPMPYWMKYGISQMEKGKKDGYELIKE